MSDEEAMYAAEEDRLQPPDNLQRAETTHHNTCSITQLPCVCIAQNSTDTLDTITVAQCFLKFQCDLDNNFVE